MMVRVVALFSVSLLLLGCFGSNDTKPEDTAQIEKGATLADLQPAVMPDTQKKVAFISEKQVAQHYRKALELTRDPEMEVKIRQRLAGLEMAHSEKTMLNEQEKNPDQFFGDTIFAYQQLLQRYPDRNDNDRLLYQLSKAYELDGRLDEAMKTLGDLVERYPLSEYYPEAQFRRAEWHFTNKRYPQAAKAYDDVIGSNDAVYLQSALYMHGWTQFKRSRYDSSVKSFTQLLDGLLDGSQSAKANQELVNDSLRVLSLAFSYLDGAKTIKSMYARLGERHYQHRLYDSLGELYLSKLRYRDSVETYRAYIDDYPRSKYAHSYYVKLIAAYETGKFGKDALQEKENYVNRFNIHSSYFQTADAKTKTEIKANLHDYMEILGQYYHAIAQKLSAKKAASAKIVAAYKDTANWYSQFIETFPNDSKTPEKVFLLAESLFEAKDYVGAIAAYEKAAYEYEKHPHGAEAGYAAILSYDTLVKNAGRIKHAGSRDVSNWKSLRVESALRFSQKFADDKRAAPVLAQVAEQLFAQNDYVAASEAANRLLNWPQPLPNSLTKTALLVTGHSQFELKNYVAAEQAYLRVKPMIGPKETTQRKAVSERIAAAVYKQAEQSVAAEDKQQAVDHFLRIAALAPAAAIGINAQYDAATLLMEMKQWPQAISVLRAFRQQHPSHKLTAGVPAKLAVAYQENKQWKLAASELSILAARDDDPEAQRQALYLAAELYQKSGDVNNAIDKFRSYAHKYPQPFDDALEAKHQLSEMYAKQNEDAKQRFWLKKIMDADKNAGKQRTARSKYLAASASNVFADDAYYAYQKIKLTLPIKKSLKRKKSALDKTLKAYNKTMSYGIQEFSTASAYRIGEVYAQLSRDLMASQRPKNLNELELEQYEILLEEQAFPFEEKAIQLHERNAQRSWQGIYDEGVKSSFSSLSKLLPARYNKQEQGLEYSRDIY